MSNTYRTHRPQSKLTPYSRALVEVLLSFLRECPPDTPAKVRCAELASRFQDDCRANPRRGLHISDTESLTRFGMTLNSIVPPVLFRRRQFLVDGHNSNHYVFPAPADLCQELERLLTEGTVQERTRNADGRRITILEQRVADLLARVDALEAKAANPTPNPQK